MEKTSPVITTTLPTPTQLQLKPQLTKLKWLDNQTDGQQYPSVPMLAKIKATGNINMPNFMLFLSNYLSTNAQKLQTVVNEWRGAGWYLQASINRACQNVDDFFQAIGPQYQTKAYGQLDG